MVAEVALFDESLISPQVQAALPEGYTLRPLRANDYERGFLKVLEVLTEVGNQTKEEWMERFNYLKQHNHEYFTIAITDDRSDKVVAAGTIFVERKFVHNNGLVGHIEDIAVDGQQQGKKLGLRIIQALKFIGAKRNCYKVILDCSAKNIPFYEKCGFAHKEYEMAWYVTKSNL
ncbi:acyl-CoA N-acyltransferase [Lichtheimia hyalospora FSU 10163]|nr:acyl-CoA N-acyltransferase [Lichtheimia hyalospora FSU 10163]